MIPTILLSASTYELVGTALANAQIALTLTRSDIVAGPGGGIVAAGRTVIACDGSGLGSAQVFPNAAGTQSTGYLVEVFDSTGALRLTARASLPNQNCNLHEVLFTIPPMSQDDADRSVTDARSSASASAASASAAATSAIATAQDRVQTGLDRTQTGLDRVQTGIDVTTAAGSLSGALNASLTAIAQASLATVMALASASAVQQDLSGVTLAAQHRSPNPVVQTLVIDTSRDSDGGAWREKCAHLSWMNEVLSGAALVVTSPDGFQSELDARGVGATLGAEQVTDPTFTSAAGWNADATATIAGGKLTFTATPSGSNLARRLDMAFPATPALYQVTVQVDSLTAGAIGVRPGTNATNLRTLTSPGTHVFTLMSSTVALTAAQLNAVGTTTGVVSKYSIKPVTAFVTKSGAYYQLATDGKFYRLFQNQHANSASPAAAGYAFTLSGAGDALTPNFGLGLNGTLTTTRVQTGATARVLRLVSNDCGVTEVSAPYLVSFHYRGTLNFGLSLRAGVGVNPTDLGVVSGTLKRAYVILTSGTNGAAFLDFNLAVNSDFELGDIQVERLVTATAGQTPSAYELRTGSNASATVAGVETFRGNTAKFPRLGLPAAEAGSISLYALDQPGRPMWGRWAFAAGTFGSITSMAYKDGKIFAGTSLGLLTLDLAGDIGRFQQVGNDRTFRLTDRASGAQTLVTHAPVQVLPAAAPVNSVTVMTRPTAPSDPVTGLPVPTVAVTPGNGNGGIVGVVFMDDGTTVTYGVAGNDGASVFFTPRGDIGFSLFSTGNTQVCVLPLATANVANVLVAPGVRTYSPANIPGMGVGGRKKVIAAGNVLAGVSPVIASNMLSLVRENPSTPAQGLAAQITGVYNTGWMRGDIRRAMFIDTVVGSVDSSERVTNGSFTNGVVGWTADGGATTSTITANAGVGTITVVGAEGNARFAPPSFNLTAGRTYRANVQVTANPNARRIILTVSQAQSGFGAGDYAQQITAVTTYSTQFIASATGAYFFNVGFDGTGVAGDTLSFTGVSITEVVADRSVKAKPAAVIGTLTRAPVGVNSQLVAYGGFSAANYVQEAYSADLDPGTGALFVPIWGTIPANVAAVGTAVDRSAAAGAYYRLGHDATGKIVGELFDGTTTKTVTSPAAYNTGQLFTASMEYVPNGAASTLTLRVNGQVVVTSTFAALLTLTNAAAPITYGNRRDTTAPWAGTLAMVKPSMGFTPFTEEEQWACEQERQMFRDGAQVTLADTSNLIGEDYDAQEGSLTVTSATVKSKFVGLVRTNSETPQAGSFAGVAHGSGIKALIRTGTSPGVDITLPSQNLKEELLRRSESAARAFTVQPFNFDAIANQTEFPLVDGWETFEVNVARSPQREGATKDWVRKFDGFKETVSLGTPQALNTWVQVIARRAAA